jgi:hypothetical protein
MNKAPDLFNAHRIVFSSVFLLLLFLSFRVSAQVLIAGTTFNPSPGNAGRTYIGVNDILQYGLQTGAISITPPIAPNVNANVFNSTYYYAITDNPYKLDNVRYNNLATPAYQLVASSAASTPSNLLSYTVSGLAPGSNVTAKITYCYVISPTYATCGPGEILSLRGVLNPDQFNTMNGLEGTQLHAGQCLTTDLVLTQATSNSNVVGSNGQAVFNINNQQTGSCKAVGITKMEIYGTPMPIVTSSQGTDVCDGEDITLQTTINYNATYQWQVNSGAGWANITGGTNPAQLYTLTGVKTYQFRVILTYAGSPITSNPISVNSITCCTQGTPPVPASRQTIFYDNFGRLDLTDKTGGKYFVWDYSNPLNPVEVAKTTATPFRWPLVPAPLAATFVGASPSPLNDGQYTVAAYLTGYNSPLNGYAGAQLQWANRVLGLTTIPNPDITYDHSGAADGAALFLNCPANTMGQIMYSRNIPNLCFGKQLFFECWIAVFTNSAAGVYNPVNVLVKLTDGGNAGNVVTTSGTATRQADGGGVWVRLSAQITLSAGSTSLQMDIINNENVSIDGNDLVLDDIKIMACAPPAIDLFFDLTTLSKAESVCGNTMDLVSSPTTLLNTYYGNAPMYLFQWTRTPNVLSSWTNIGSPQAAPSFTMPNPKTNVAFVGLPSGSNVYFRIIAATAGIYTTTSNFTAPNYANINDPCKNYSVSTSIAANLDCPLPVELISFSGLKDGSINKLTWSTAFEKNNNFFVIEKSSDAIDFTVIGRVSGKGNSFTTETYHFNDNTISDGNNYYRLRQVDLGGAYNYSNIIVLRNNLPDLTVYPNPNNGSFEISIVNPGQSYKLDITDLEGKLKYSASGTDAPETIKVNQLPEGFYILKLTIDTQVVTKKVVVY